MKTTRALALSSVLMIGLAACAEGSVSGGSDDGSSAAGLEKISFGLFPSSAVAAVQLGIDKGFFEEQGLDLELVLGQGSAAQLPSLSSGSLQFMLTSPTTPLVATTQGLDIRIVSGYAQNRPDIVTDSVAVMVPEGSDIESAKDLEGKTVSVNALGSIGDIGIREAVALDGGDPDEVTFVQLGFPEVAAQLESGQIDAGMAGPPFMQQIQAAGGAVASDFIQLSGLGGAELVIASSGKFVESNPETVEKFNTALAETLDYAEANLDEVRDQLPELLDTDPAIAAKTDFIEYDAELDVDAIDKFAELLAKYEIVDKKPVVDDAVWTG